MSIPEIPLVSIIMNCYNGEKYLHEALDSIINQTYKNWELIFWDNQSTDDSEKIVLSYNDHRIKYFYSKKHTILYEARNLAIEKSMGGYLAFLDVDDYWDSTKLEKQMGVFSKNSEVAIVYSNFYFKNEIKNTLKRTHNKNLPEGMIVEDLLRKYVISLLTVVINLDIAGAKDQIFNPKWHMIGDFDMSIRISSKKKISCVQEPLATYRWHGENESIVNQERNIKELERWGLEMMQFPEISNNKVYTKFLDYIKYLKAMMFVMKGEKIKAIKYFFNLSFGKEKIKLLISIMLPLTIIKLLKNTYHEKLIET